MYLIQAMMSGTLTSIPPFLPPSLYAEAALSTSTAAFDTQFVSERNSSPSSPLDSAAWDVPADVRVNAETFFEVFDERRQGYLNRDVIEAHLKQTGLPEHTLQHIWLVK
jgi:epidermal growth factor receptor substrate 15